MPQMVKRRAGERSTTPVPAARAGRRQGPESQAEEQAALDEAARVAAETDASGRIPPYIRV